MNNAEFIMYFYERDIKFKLNLCLISDITFYFIECILFNKNEIQNK
jgi:hypothetical protein